MQWFVQTITKPPLKNWAYETDVTKNAGRAYSEQACLVCVPQLVKNNLYIKPDHFSKSQFKGFY